MTDDEAVLSGTEVFTHPSASHRTVSTRLRSRRTPRRSVIRIEIHEDMQYRWWWALDDDERVTMHGPYDTKRDAKNDAHAEEPHVHIAIVPWKLP